MKELIPQRKVVAGGATGAITYLIIRVLDHFGIQLQAEDAVALLTVVTFVAQWLVPNAKVQPAPENPV